MAQRRCGAAVSRGQDPLASDVSGNLPRHPTEEVGFQEVPTENILVAELAVDFS